MKYTGAHGKDSTTHGLVRPDTVVEVEHPLRATRVPIALHARKPDDSQ
jgi:hypothetical protein